jgi:3-dehydroquinate dehydratase II
MKRHVYILNGPNLNLLGKREPHLYGYTTLDQVRERCLEVATELGFEVFFGQSNYEGQLVDWIHEAREREAAVVINPAGLSFTSIPLLDALKTLTQPIIEVHITQIHKREEIYQKSLVSKASTAVICGLGPFGYEAALLGIADQFRQAEAASGDKSPT